MSSQHILIIGAGICGLAIAQGLRKANISYTVFEAEDSQTSRSREWTMGLHWGLPMLESLLPSDLAARLRTEVVVDASLDFKKYPNNVVPLYDGVSGELVKEIPFDGMRVSRRELRKACAEGIDIKFGHTLTHVTNNEKNNSVTAHFTNGSSYTGTILIGTDGVRSIVRQEMFGEKLGARSSLDHHWLNVTFRYPDAEKALQARSASPVASVMVHPDSITLLSIQDVRDLHDPTSWYFQATMTWKGDGTAARLTNEDKHAEMRERAAKLQEPMRSVFLCISSDIDIRYSRLGYWIPPSQLWDTKGGRVTLAGDAAHPMPPHRGQGLNNALNDACNFVAVVQSVEKSGSKGEAVEEYSREVAERGGKEVKLSKEAADLMLDYDRFWESPFVMMGLKKRREEGVVGQREGSLK